MYFKVRLVMKKNNLFIIEPIWYKNNDNLTFVNVVSKTSGQIQQIANSVYRYPSKFWFLVMKRTWKAQNHPQCPFMGDT